MTHIILVLFGIFVLSYISVKLEESERDRIRKNITSKNVL